MGGSRSRNVKLAAAIKEAGWSYNDLASAIRRLAAETGAHDYDLVSRSHVGWWVAGTMPSGIAPQLIVEALSRKLRRVVMPSDLGFPGDVGATGISDWDTDTLALIDLLADLARSDTDLDRRDFAFSAATFIAAAATVPPESWWVKAAALRGPAAPITGRLIGRGDLQAVTDMVALFSRMDQRHGGGHARGAVIQYLSSDVAAYLRGRFASDEVRTGMFSAASELAYLIGWMSFDDAQHGLAQRYFLLGVKLAAEAGNPPMAGHILRAMAHQAIDLGHSREALELAEASVHGERLTLASPRERALLGVIHARSLAINGQQQAASAALLHAEDSLAAAESGDDEPARVFFFGEASLAHETACCLRDSGDLNGALREFRRSVRTRKASTFTRTHAVTLGYLGSVQARQGNIEEACGTWTRALDAMDGVHSGRTRQTVLDMRTLLSPFRQRGIRVVNELDSRANAYLATAS